MAAAVMTRTPATTPLRRVAALRPAPVAPRRLPDSTYRRRRLLALAGLAVLALGCWLALQAAVSGAGGGPLTATGAAGSAPAAARTWVVRPGDTLWGIALAAGARGDIRPYVDRLAAETAGRPLVVGEHLALP